jgi:hypothetical protein
VGLSFGASSAAEAMSGEIRVARHKQTSAIQPNLDMAVHAI